jgi:hypothetical protein
MHRAQLSCCQFHAQRLWKLPRCLLMAPVAERLNSSVNRPPEPIPCNRTFASFARLCVIGAELTDKVVRHFESPLFPNYNITECKSKASSNPLKTLNSLTPCSHRFTVYQGRYTLTVHVSRLVRMSYLVDTVSSLLYILSINPYYFFVHIHL